MVRNSVKKIIVSMQDGSGRVTFNSELKYSHLIGIFAKYQGKSIIIRVFDYGDESKTFLKTEDNILLNLESETFVFEELSDGTIKFPS